MTDTLFVYSDGAVRGRNKVCMTAYVVQDDISNVIAHEAKFDGHRKSSTQCEIEAAIYAIKQVNKLFDGVKTIVLFTDSMDVVYRTKSVISKAHSKAYVEIQWIPRSANAADNEINTFALRNHINKSARRMHYEFVDALAK